MVLSFVVAGLILKDEGIHNGLVALGDLGYIGAFIAGIFFVSSFTVAIGGIVMLILSEQLHVVELAVIAGLGGVVGDLTIFRYVKNRGLINELKVIVEHLGGLRLRHLVRTQYFAWTLPVVGALIIASPLPDELGVTLMGLSKMPTWKFITLSFFLNTLGILVILGLGKII